MSSEDRAYHERRAEMQRRMAEYSSNPIVRQAHLALAALHDSNARDAAPGRPVLGIALRD